MRSSRFGGRHNHITKPWDRLVLFAIGIVSLIIIGMLIVCLGIGWLTLHAGESFQDRYAKGVAWGVVANGVFGVGIVLLFILAQWVAEKTGVW